MSMSRRTVPSLTLSVTLIIAAAIGLSFSGCSGTSEIAGNGSGTGVGNGVVMGKVRYADSTAVRNALVRLRPQTFLADTFGIPTPIENDSIKTVLTDSNGVFIIDSVDTAVQYCIEVNDRKPLAEGTLYKIDSMVTDTLHLPDRTAALMTTIKGSIKLSGLPSNAYVQIYGIDKIGKTDSLGRFEITELPTGDCEEGECEYKLRILVPKAGGGYTSKIAELELSNSANGIVEVELEYEGH
jgi:hypothetical protein